MTQQLTITPTSTADAMATTLLPSLKGLLSIDFNQHDTRLKACLTAAINRVSSWTGATLIPSTAVLVVSTPIAWRIPVVPFVAVTGAELDGVTLTDLAPYAGGYIPDMPVGSELKLTVTTGYTTLPGDLAEAICLLAGSLFDNIPREWKTLARAYRTVTWAS
ncbi:hypothetical protein [Rudanella lutea]|uniref:hypothetical protein n=1 Tax=Rudanella lutea TaxID=451374 RepID=UPI00037923DE|nr:hypothetical protein [Rudanella lutea]